MGLSIPDLFLSGVVPEISARVMADQDFPKERMISVWSPSTRARPDLIDDGLDDNRSITGLGNRAEMSTDTLHPDMETDILQHLHESAMRNFDLGNYFEAEALLGKLLNLSEAKYGPQFQGRDATRQTLIAALCKQGKLDDAERVLAKYGPQFECKAEPLEILATACCNENKLGKAEFFLLELLKDPTTQPLQRSTAMHDLAAIYLTKNDLEAAEEYCKQSVEERESILGEGHPFVYQSITLLGRIYAVKDNLQGKEACKNLLPHNFQRKISFLLTDQL